MKQVAAMMFDGCRLAAGVKGWHYAGTTLAPQPDRVPFWNFWIVEHHMLIRLGWYFSKVNKLCFETSLTSSDIQRHCRSVIRYFFCATSKIKYFAGLQLVVEEKRSARITNLE